MRRISHIDYLVVPDYRVSYRLRRGLCCIDALLDSSVKCSKIIASKETIQTFSRHWEQPPLTKDDFYDGIDTNPQPDRQKESDFLKKRKRQPTFIEMTLNVPLSLPSDITLTNHFYNIHLDNTIDTFILSQDTQTTKQLPITVKQPNKFRHIDRQPYRSGCLLTKFHYPTNLSIIIPNSTPSLQIIMMINNRALIIDPSQGIISRIKKYQIQAVILTSSRYSNHTGLLELLLNGKITIITHRTIYQRVRQYYKQLYLIDNMSLRPITIGCPFKIRQLSFKFYIGFSQQFSIWMVVKHKEKSMIFYGNSLYDYDRLKEAQDISVMSQDRFRQLTDLRWELHNLMVFNLLDSRWDMFNQLPQVIKNKIFLNFYNRQHSYPRKYLNLLGQWDCLQIDYEEKYDMVQAVVDFVGMLPVDKVLEVVVAMQESHIPKGGKIVASEKVYVVGMGHMKKQDTVFSKGDCLNYRQFVSHEECEFQAMEKAILVWLSKADYNRLFNQSQMITIEQSYLGQKAQPAVLFQRNQMSQTLNPVFLKKLEAICQQQLYKSGDTVWDIGQPCRFLVFIQKGSLVLHENKQEKELSGGYFVGQYFSIGKTHTTKLEVMKDSYLYMIRQENIDELLQSHPEVKYYLMAMPISFI